jgi:acetylornithine deacetylase/succinyl-diaminopimelate desuccinylase-like protein
MVNVGGFTTHGAHSDDEWVDLDTLDPQIGFVCDFIMNSGN